MRTKEVPVRYCEVCHGPIERQRTRDGYLESPALYVRRITCAKSTCRKAKTALGKYQAGWRGYVAFTHGNNRRQEQIHKRKVKEDAFAHWLANRKQ